LLLAIAAAIAIPVAAIPIATKSAAVAFATPVKSGIILRRLGASLRLGTPAGLRPRH